MSIILFDEMKQRGRIKCRGCGWWVLPQHQIGGKCLHCRERESGKDQIDWAIASKYVRE